MAAVPLLIPAAEIGVQLAPVAIEAAIAAAPVVKEATVEGAKVVIHGVEKGAQLSKQVAQKGSSIAEKLLLATIIFICLILLCIGYVLWNDSHTTAGGIFFFLGTVGIAGSIYWAYHPVTPQIFGAAEESYGSEGEIFDDMPEEDIDYIEVTDLDDTDLDGYGGGSEHGMPHLLEMLSQGPKMHSRIREDISEKGVKIEDKTKATLEAIDQYGEKIKVSNKDHVKEASSLIGEFKKLSVESMAGLNEIEGKLSSLQKSL